MTDVAVENATAPATTAPAEKTTEATPTSAKPMEPAATATSPAVSAAKKSSEPSVTASSPAKLKKHKQPESPSSATSSATSPGQPKFNKKSTAEQVASVWGERIRGKTVVITGANVGLGFETARVLAMHGANVVITCRNAEKVKDAVEKLKKAVPEGVISGMELELSSLRSVQAFVDKYVESKRPLHVLINNAGVMACPRAETADGLEMQFGVNHIGHYLLTTGLWPVLKANGTSEYPTRIANLSSAAHWLSAPKKGIYWDDLDGKKKYNPWKCYGQSKLANVLFTRYLHKRAGDEQTNIVSVSLHPGVIMQTDLKKHISFKTAMQSLGLLSFKNLGAMINDSPKSIPQGAATTVYATLCPDVVPGEYYADCAVEAKHVHPWSKDSAVAERLHQESEKIVKEKLAKAIEKAVEEAKTEVAKKVEHKKEETKEEQKEESKKEEPKEESKKEEVEQETKEAAKEGEVKE